MVYSWLRVTVAGPGRRMAERRTELAACDDVKAELAALRADLARFKRDFKRALVLQAIVIVTFTVTLIKLLP